MRPVRARTGVPALLGAGALVVLVVVAALLVRASREGAAPAPARPVVALDPPLAQRLRAMPERAPVRLLVTVAPDTPTEPLQRDLERLGGRLVERFTLVDVVVVVAPAGRVRELAELPQVRQVEPADTGETPPG